LQELEIKPSIINKAIKVGKNRDWSKHYDDFEDLEGLITIMGYDK